MDAEEAGRLLVEEYGRLAEVYEAHVVPQNAALVRRLLELAAVKPGEQVLDLGCGPGNLVFEVTRRVCRNGRVEASISRTALRALRTTGPRRGASGTCGSKEWMAGILSIREPRSMSSPHVSASPPSAMGSAFGKRTGCCALMGDSCFALELVVELGPRSARRIARRGRSCAHPVHLWNCGSSSRLEKSSTRRGSQSPSGSLA